MKKSIMVVLLLLIATLTSANINVRVPGATPYVVLVQNQSITALISPGNTYYTFDTIGPGVGTCLILKNHNPTNTRVIYSGVTITPSVSDTTSNGIILISAGLPFNVPANGAQAYFFPTFGAAHVTVQLIGTANPGGSPDTLDAFVVQAPSCPSGATQSTTANQFPVITEHPVQWSAVSFPGVVNSQASASVAASTGVTHHVDCITASAMQSSTAATQLNVKLYQSASCGSGSLLYAVGIGIPGTAGSTTIWTQCGLNLTSLTGGGITACFNAANTTIYEGVTMIGHDE